MSNTQEFLSFPKVSVAIPTYNEAANIEHVILTFLQSGYPNLVEVVVADGGSQDSTRDIVLKLSSKDSRVKLIHNPRRIQTFGLNLVLQQCKGDIFLRADAHAEYAPDYIEKCVATLQKTRAFNVGGAQRPVAKSAFQAGVALATSSPLGNGGAKYRNPEYNGYADTVYLGCFWKDVLVKVGGYDTEKCTNEDAELNLRLSRYVNNIFQANHQSSEINQCSLHQSEEAIYVSSEIRVWYYPRETWLSLFTQYFKYGRGRYLTTTQHCNKSQLRGKLPSIAILTFISLLFIDLLIPTLKLPLCEFILVILLVPCLESLRVSRKFSHSFYADIWRGDLSHRPRSELLWFFCVVALVTMPIAHFSGYGYQFLRQKLMRADGW